MEARCWKRAVTKYLSKATGRQRKLRAGVQQSTIQSTGPKERGRQKTGSQRQESGGPEPERGLIQSQRNIIRLTVQEKGLRDDADG